MSIDPVSSERNFQLSLKKFFIDSLVKAELLDVSFDTGLSIPSLNPSVSKWVVINFGTFHNNVMATASLDVVLCTRKDVEGDELAKLRDILFSYLVGADENGMLTIPLYDTLATPWVEAGSICAFVDPESPRLTAPDETKYKIVPMYFKWGSR